MEMKETNVLCSSQIFTGFFKENRLFTIAFVTLILTTYPLQSYVLTKSQANLITSFTLKKDVHRNVVVFISIYLILNILKAILGVVGSKLRPLFLMYSRNRFTEAIANGCERGCLHTKSSESMTNIMNMPWDLYDTINRVFTHIIPDSVLSMTTMYFLFTNNRQIGIASFCTFVIVIYVSWKEANEFDFSKIHQANIELHDTYDDRLHSLFDIFAHNNFEFEKNKIDSDEMKQYNSHVKAIMLKTRTIGIVKGICICFIAYSLFVLSKTYNDDINKTTSIIVSVLYMTVNLTVLSDNILTSSQFKVDIELIDEFMSRFSIPEKNHGNLITGIDTGIIKFKDVSFQYLPNAEKQIQIDTTMQPGTINCIIGRSGIGKTTIVHMLLGFNSTYKGQITIDGHDIQHLSLKYLRKNVSICGQYAFIRSGTLLENLTYSTKYQSSSDMEKERNVKKYLFSELRLSRYFNDFRQDLHTEISPKEISGGQKQLINFCRTILRDTKIMIFDEPTSAMNTELSDVCLNILQKLSLTKCIVLITHNARYHSNRYNCIHVH